MLLLNSKVGQLDQKFSMFRIRLTTFNIDIQIVNGFEYRTGSRLNVMTLN